jgi:hypothetical protein
MTEMTDNPATEDKIREKEGRAENRGFNDGRL